MLEKMQKTVLKYAKAKPLPAGTKGKWGPCFSRETAGFAVRNRTAFTNVYVSNEGL